MSCNNCGKDYNIVNKKYMLCQICNHKRLHPEEDAQQGHLAVFRRTIIAKEYKPIKRTKIVSTGRAKTKREELLEKDKATYFIVFNSKPNFCEECNAPLNNKFLDDRGRINMIWQYSHILSKGSAPEHRHNPINFNRLCFDCHQKWEFSDKSKMKIYEKNKIIIEKLKSYDR